VLLMPGSNIVCALVGHRQMRPKLFFPLVVIGTVARLWWVWIAADHFDSQLKDALRFISRYQWWLGGGFLALALCQSWRRTKATARRSTPVVRQETPRDDD